MTDISKTIEQLEGQVWPLDTYPTHVVQESQRLRRVPLRDLTVEDLRLLVSQGIGLNLLVPLALEVLAKNALAEGQFYPGDLLVSVLNVPAEFWSAHPKLNNDLVDLAPALKSVQDLLMTEVLPKLGTFQYK